MWLLGVVVRRYIDFLILLIPTPLVSALFCSSIPTFYNVFRSLHVCLDIFTRSPMPSCLGKMECRKKLKSSVCEATGIKA